MWIKVDMIPKNTQVIIWDDGPNGGGDSWLELMSDGTIQTQRGGDGFGVFRSKTLVKPREWTHIAFVANEKKDKKILYINGMVQEYRFNFRVCQFNFGINSNSWME